MGTGMAFPWPLIRDAPLAIGHLVEDMQLGLDLAARRHAAAVLPDALRDAASSRCDRAGGAHASARAGSTAISSMIVSVGPRLLGARRCAGPAGG